MRTVEDCTRTANPGHSLHIPSSVEGYCRCGEAYRQVLEIGDEVLVRCRVVGPSGLMYGMESIVLDLLPLDSNGGTSGGQFTVSAYSVDGVVR